MDFESWFEDEFGEPPDMEDECVADMMLAFYAGLEAADGYYTVADMFDIEDVMLEEFGL